MGGQNVAARDLGSVPFGSSSLQGYCSSSAGGKGIKLTGIHCWANINDGHLGNSHSWIPGGSGPHFVGVVFAEQKNIAGFRISRKGAGTCCNDRIGGSYTVQYTLASDADHETPNSSWTNLGTFSRSTLGFEYFSFCREIRAAAIRIVVSRSDSCIDELEIYEGSATTCPEKYPKCQYWYCVIASCASSSCSWSRAPTRDTEPAGTYTYISGYDATGSHCTGDFPLEEPTPEPTPDPTPEPTPERSFLQQLAESNSSHTIHKHRFLASSFVQVDTCSRSAVHLEEVEDEQYGDEMSMQGMGV